MQGWDDLDNVVESRPCGLDADADARPVVVVRFSCFLVPGSIIDTQISVNHLLRCRAAPEAPIEASIPASMSLSVNAIDVYCDPRSLW